MKYNSIPCKHVKCGLKSSVKVDDYYPLTKEQILELLDEALKSGNPSCQQARLMQAIPDIKCPRDIAGDAAKKVIKLSNYFMIGIRRGYWTDSQKHEMILICSEK